MSDRIQPTKFNGKVVFEGQCGFVRAGLVALTTDLMVERVYRDVTRGLKIDTFVNRIAYQNPITHENLRAMEGDLGRCLAGILPDEPLDVVAFACSSGTVAIGQAKLEQHIGAIKPGAKSTNPVKAAAAGLRALAAKRVSILTPYSSTVNEDIARYFHDCGFDVLRIVGFDIASDIDVAGLSERTILDGAREATSDGSEALFLSCTAMPAAHMAERIEREVGLPVVTSNQALAWHTLRLGGIGATVAGFGRLLTLPLAKS